MLAKLIAHGESREEAVKRLGDALESLVLEGIIHNAPLHEAILEDPKFLSGAVHTGLLADVQERIVAP